MKAIETVYNGYRFRSRLEARWAVFFDALGIKYEYEPEGYAFEDGTCYLPDFLCRDLLWWIEVKPTLDISRESHHKATLLALNSKMPVLIVGQLEDRVRCIAFLKFPDPEDDYVLDDIDPWFCVYWDAHEIDAALRQAKQARF